MFSVILKEILLTDLLKNHSKGRKEIYGFGFVGGLDSSPSVICEREKNAKQHCRAIYQGRDLAIRRQPRQRAEPAAMHFQ